jgi:molybdopterin-guanine dinucleotide biosynthesis protein A
LAVGEKTLLEHVVGQIAPCFDEVLVSLSRRNKTALPKGMRTGVAIVTDETPGLGPIGGILAGLKAARNEACAVIACDIPDIDIPLLRRIARAADGFEIAVPTGPSGLHEPLFAVYRRSVAPRIEALLAGGERSVLPLYGRCRTAFVRMDGAAPLRNLNTRGDYEAYLRSISPGKIPGRSKGKMTGKS